MKQRCYNKKHPQYNDYGKRGIEICNRWLNSFDNFQEDMAFCWRQGLEIDRIDNDGDYFPSNCRWVVREVNNQNRRIKKGSSMYRGVRFHTRDKSWQAHISVNNKTVHLGTFKAEEEAARAYDSKALELYGPECALNFPLIRVRDDDVLIKSSGCDSFKRFQQIHGWIRESKKFIHVPAVLATEIQEFPECIEFVREETKAGRMVPETHGLKHIDYAKLTKEDIKEHLKQCKEFNFKNFGRVPKRFMTPWGANADHIREASEECGLELVDCSKINKLQGRYGMVQLAKDGRDLEKFLSGGEIFCHFWEGGMRLKRVIEVVKHGSWEAAKAANGKWFD